MAVSPIPANGTWLTMKEIAEKYGLTSGKMSIVVARHQIETRNNPLDGRSKLVRLEDVQAILGPAKAGEA